MRQMEEHEVRRLIWLALALPAGWLAWFTTETIGEFWILLNSTVSQRDASGAWVTVNMTFLDRVLYAADITLHYSWIGLLAAGVALLVALPLRSRVGAAMLGACAGGAPSIALWFTFGGWGPPGFVGSLVGGAISGFVVASGRAPRPRGEPREGAGIEA